MGSMYISLPTVGLTNIFQGHKKGYILKWPPGLSRFRCLHHFIPPPLLEYTAEERELLNCGASTRCMLYKRLDTLFDYNRYDLGAGCISERVTTPLLLGIVN